MDMYSKGGFAAALIASLLTAGCGGSDEASYEDLRREADSLRSEAVAQVNNSPCASDNECTGLVFRFPYFTCDQHDQHTYSKRSPSAAQAEALAARQRGVAEEAIYKAPLPDFFCTMNVQPAPVHVCVANRCEQRPG